MLTRTYRGGGHEVRGVDSVSLAAARGEVVAVTGPSGSGKSTLLFLLGGLDTPDEGQVRVAGVDWATLRGRARARFRRRTCGFIVQGLALLPQATAAENVEVPLLLDGIEPAARDRRVAGGARTSGTRAALGEADRPTLRWPAATGGDRESPGRRTRGRSGRRAHRKPGLGDRPGHRRGSSLPPRASVMRRWSWSRTIPPSRLTLIAWWPCTRGGSSDPLAHGAHDLACAETGRPRHVWGSRFRSRCWPRRSFSSMTPTAP